MCNHFVLYINKTYLALIVKQVEFSSTRISGSTELHRHMESALAVSYKVKHTFNNDAEIPDVSVYPRKIKTHSHKELFMNVPVLCSLQTKIQATGEWAHQAS